MRKYTIQYYEGKFIHTANFNKKVIYGTLQTEAVY